MTSNTYLNVTEFSRNPSAEFHRLQHAEGPTIVTRRGRPEAYILSPQQMEELEQEREAHEDLKLLVMAAIARLSQQNFRDAGDVFADLGIDMDAIDADAPDED